MLDLRVWQRAVAVTVLSASAALVVVPASALSAQPGALISESPRPDGWHGIPGGSAIEYWMAGSDGTPQQASGALFIPKGAPPQQGWPIMAYDHGTLGLGQGCGGQADPEQAPFPAGRAKEDLIMAHLVSRGFAVVAPDYLGLGRFATGPHPYLEIRTEATATIDLVRAVRSTHSELSGTWGVIGVSQGGQAALGAAHLEPSYAPELDFRGAVAIDPASDIENLLDMAGPAIPAVPNTEDFMAFFVSILAGFRAAQPQLDFDRYLSPLGRAMLDDVGTMCLDRIIDRVHGLGVGDLLPQPLADEIRPALDTYLGVPTSGYQAPILLLLNMADMVVPSPLHLTLAARFAASGVDFHAVNGLGRHVNLTPEMWSALDTFLTRLL